MDADVHMQMKTVVGRRKIIVFITHVQAAQPAQIYEFIKKHENVPEIEQIIELLE